MLFQWFLNQLHRIANDNVKVNLLDSIQKILEMDTKAKKYASTIS